MKIKKIIAVTLIIVSVLSMTACVSASELGMPELPKPTEYTPAPAEEAEAAENAEGNTTQDVQNEINDAHIVVSMDNTEPEYVFDPDTTDDTDNLILTFLAEKPVVYIEDNSKATEKINDFFAYMDEEIVTGDQYGVGIAEYPGKRTMTDLAYANYQVHVDYQLDNNLEFAFSHTVEVMRCDSRIISFLFTDYIFKGEGSGLYSKYAVSFSTETGEAFDTDYFSSVDGVRESLSTKVKEMAETDEKLSRLMKSASYADILSGLTDFGSWFVGKENVVFLGSTESSDDINSAVFEIALDADEIKDNVSEVFPADRYPGNGTVSVSGDSEFGKNVSDMIKFSDGETVFLDIDGIISDVRVSYVQYSDADEKFFTKSVYWAGNYLTDCLLQITADIPDGMPNIKIEFYSGGEYNSLLLSQSGYDGKPILVDSSIIAVG